MPALLPADDILADLRARLRSDPAWRRFVGPGVGWICPQCRATVTGQAPTRPSLLAAMRQHLVGCAPAPAGGATLAEAHQLAILRHRLGHDPAWGFRTGDTWRCPACLEAHAAPLDGSGDATDAVHGHLATCDAWSRGVVHDALAVADAEARAAPSEPAEPAEPGTESRAARAEQVRDLERAQAVQKRLMRDPPRLAGYRFATRYLPCSAISGDFNQFIQLPDGHIGFAQGDVSGHGVQAGLIMAMANKLIEVYASLGLGPKETLVRVNEALIADLGGKMFITMAYAVLDPARREVCWVRAGHNPTLLRSRGQPTRQLLPKGMMVGTHFREVFDRVLTEERTVLEPGDVLVLFTDGLTEAMDSTGEEWGVDRLVEVLERHADEGPEALIGHIFSAAQTFCDHRPMGDDASMIILGVD